VRYLFYNTFALVRCISLKRMLNALLVLLGYFFALILKRVVLKSMPISVAIEPINACNLSCPECPIGQKMLSRQSGKMTVDVFHRIIQQVHEYSSVLTLFFQGEPFLNSNIFEMIRYAKEKRMFTIISTNGHFLSENHCREIIKSGLDKLIISLDGLQQETYASYRVGGEVQKVKEGIQRLVQMKKTMRVHYPLIEVQMLLLRTNEQEVGAMQQFARATGVDKVAFKTAQFYDFKYGNDLMPINEKYARYKKQLDGTYVLKKKVQNRCYRMWSSCVFTWDGKVVPCCFDKDANYMYGDIMRERFKNIWFGSMSIDFKKRVLKNRKQYPMCSNCSE